MPETPPILADVIAVGSEMLGSARLDTNSLYLARALAGHGVALRRKLVVGDDRREIARALTESLPHVRWVFLCGGLGPTADDQTREGVALALGRELAPDPERRQALRTFFAERGRELLAMNLRPADLIQGAAWLDNPVGSAPGQWCAAGGATVILLPGPPAELQATFTASVAARLREAGPAAAFFTRVLSVAGMPESEVEAAVAPLYGADAVAVTILATAGPHVELHLLASGATAEEAQTRADTLALEMEARLQPAVFSRDQESLPEVVGKRLRRRGEQVAVAESCTGGLLAARLTEVAGASEFFSGGVVCYSDAWKRDAVGVPAAVLAERGAVSSEVAAALAENVRARAGVAWGIGLTGFAGPDGGTPEAPLGTVFFGFARAGRPVRVERMRFYGDRDRIRRFATQFALNYLRLELERLDRGVDWRGPQRGSAARPA